MAWSRDDARRERPVAKRSFFSLWGKSKKKDDDDHDDDLPGPNATATLFPLLALLGNAAAHGTVATA
jgi:hypothetical protein